MKKWNYKGWVVCINVTCEPIKNKRDVQKFLNYLKGLDERNYILAKLQLNTGLRISDIVSIKVADIFNEDFKFRSYLSLVEKKTKKPKRIKLNDTVKKSIQNYVTNNKVEYESYLFKSKKGENNPITTTQAYRIIKEVGNVFHFENFGTHSLRKTWGYHSYRESKYNIALIMAVFNHTSQSQTLKYIGMEQDDKDNLYSIVQF